MVTRRTLYALALLALVPLAIAQQSALAPRVLSFRQAAEQTYYSVVFDGSADYLSRGSDLSGNADGQLGLLSLWIKLGASTSPTTEYRIATSTSGKFLVRRSTAGKFDLTATDSAGTIILRLLSTENITNTAQWYHIAASWDLSTAGRRKVYVNGVDKTDALTFTVGTTIDYTVANHWIGASTAGAVLFNGSMCEFFFGYPSTYFDLADANQLAKLISGGKPVDLGSDGSTPLGAQPIIYLRNEYSTWNSNLGSGGNFSVTGALGDGGSDKP